MDFTYTVEVSEEDDIPCACDACGWRGLSKDVGELDYACLTPGNPSPMGRCPNPDCDGFLVYPNRLEDRARDAALDLLAALKDLMEAWTGGRQPPRRAWEKARTAIAKVEASL